MTKFRTIGMLATLLALSSSAALAAAPSALRYPGETYEQAMARVLSDVGARPHSVVVDPSASSASKPYASLDFSGVTDYVTYAQLLQAFRKVRDSRFLVDPTEAGVVRRSSWMYPDDGCFARAGVMSQKLEEWGYARPKKVFIFGNLNVKSPNAEMGMVSWWYHVVPVVTVAGAPYVFDPAIEPKEPLTLEQWVLRQVPDVKDAKLSICHELAYQPFDSCANGSRGADTNSMTDQSGFLDYERERLIQLGRDPARELGDFPPWLSAASP